MNLKSDLTIYSRDLVLNGIVPSKFVPVVFRCWMLKAYGLDVARCRIAPGGFYGGRRIRIESRVFLNYGVFIDASAQVTIQSGTQIGPQVMLCTSTHALGSEAERAGAVVALPIHIGTGAWIGARAMILPGVTIGRGCVIAAGAVVTKDCEPNTLYAGIPAKAVRSLVEQRL